MALSFALRGTRAAQAQPSVRTQEPIHTPDIEDLRRASYGAWRNWNECEPEAEQVCHDAFREAEDRLQLAITDEQRRIGMPTRSADCGPAIRREVLERIGYVGTQP